MKFSYKDPATFALIFSNILTIGLAILFNWSFITIIWSYWLQSVIIGFFNFIKILTLKDFSTSGFKINGRNVSPSALIKIFTAFFFAFHYGGFHLAYAFFLGYFTVFLNTTSISITCVLLAGVVFFVNHLFSFLYYRNKQPTKKPNIGQVMFTPYARIIPMHLTIMFGGIFLIAGDSHTLVLVFFLILKTVADIIMHRIEHRGQQT